MPLHKVYMFKFSKETKNMRQIGNIMIDDVERYSLTWYSTKHTTKALEQAHDEI